MGPNHRQKPFMSCSRCRSSILPVLCAAILCLSMLQACQPAADFHFIDGESKRLEDYQGKWLVVNFWAEWCKPCREEIPHLNEFYLARADHNAEIIAVSFDLLDNQILTEQAARLDIQYPVVATSPNPVFPFAMPGQLPANYLVAPDGQVFGPLVGKQDTESLVRAMKLLGDYQGGQR